MNHAYHRSARNGSLPTFALYGTTTIGCFKPAAVLITLRLFTLSTWWQGKFQICAAKICKGFISAYPAPTLLLPMRRFSPGEGDKGLLPQCGRSHVTLSIRLIAKQRKHPIPSLTDNESVDKGE